MKKWNNILLHSVYWTIYIFNSIIKEEFNAEEIFQPLNFSFLIVNIAAFYFNYFIVIPFVVKKGKTPIYIMGVIVSFFLFIGLRFLLEEIIFPITISIHNYAEDTSIIYYIFDNFYWGSNSVFISSLIWFLNYSLKIEKEKQQLLQQKNEAEMSLLKSQINPHFIFNTLNNIYSLVNQTSDKSLDAIEKLGDLLRFSSNEIKKDFTSLNDEIQYVKNFIELEKLRITKPENIIFEDKIQDKHMKIAPMILIPFVENAFKHGDLKNDKLLIKIKNEGNKLILNQKNKIASSNKDQSTGIGIENVRKRLDILYPEKHRLKIDNDGEFYSVNLEIDL